MAGLSEDAYEPLVMKFDNWARVSMNGRSKVPRPLLQEVDGQLSLLVGFHGTTESGLLGICVRTTGSCLQG